jgi:hypothetical protein
MKTDPKIKTSVYLPKSLLKQLKQKALDCDTSDTAQMQAAIEAWLGNEQRPSPERPGPPPYPPQHEHAHALLEVVLLEGTPKDAEWIVGNLRNFVEAIRSRGAQAAKGEGKAGVG